MNSSAIDSTRSSTLGLIGTNADALASELGGDINAQVAAMVMIAGREKRAQIQQSRQAEERLIQAMEDEQVREMRKQAAAIRHAGLLDGLGKIASGMLSVTAGGMQIDAANAATEKAAKVLEGEAACMRGYAGVAEGTAVLGSTSYNDAAKQHEANAVAADNSAAAARRRLEDLRDEAKSAEEDQRSAIDFLRDINQSAAAADRAAIFQRA